MTRHVSIPYHSSVCVSLPRTIHYLVPSTSFINPTPSSTIHNGREITVQAIQIRREAGGRYGDGGQKERRQTSTNGEQRNQPSGL